MIFDTLNELNDRWVDLTLHYWVLKEDDEIYVEKFDKVIENRIYVMIKWIKEIRNLLN